MPQSNFKLLLTQTLTTALLLSPALLWLPVWADNELSKQTPKVDDSEGRPEAPKGWALFTDPTGEMSVMMPEVVKASKTDTGGAVYDGDVGKITYRVSFRKRSGLARDVEIKRFCDIFAKKFEELMAECGHPIKISLAGETRGKNWAGRIYRYTHQSGTPGAVQVAVESRHNLVLHCMGGADTDAETRLFFNSLVVHEGD